MTPCPSCNRHLRAADGACPFCGAARAAKKSFGILGGVVTSVVLAACYGSPYKPDDSGLDTATATDADSDGYNATVDCNDADAAIHPGATEACDDTVDNDCDAKTDADDTDCAAK